MIRFEFRSDKFANAVAYLSQAYPGVTKKKLCKLLYFADKEHLLKYGRTITGDRYYRLPQGPVPTKGLDILNEKRHANPADVALMRQYGKLTGWAFHLEREPDLTVFSKSDLRVLDHVIQKYGTLPVEELVELTHKEPAWKKTPPSGAIDFELFFDGRPEAAQMMQILEAEHGCSCSR
jgi:uncharacterized phage-associated protein